MKRALYDLKTRPITFDFAPYAVLCRILGADHINFHYRGKINEKKFPADMAWKRVGNVLIPLAKIAGMTWEITDNDKGMNLIEGAYHVGHVQQVCKQNGGIIKLKPTRVAASSGHVTITIRRSFRGKFRNSDLDAWDRFAQYLRDRGEEVVIMNESELHPIDLEWRMAMYCQAKMNIGVNGGPMILLLLSDAPYIVMNMAPSEEMGQFLAAGGFPVGSQFSFKNDKQIIVWEKDTYENIVKAWHGMMG